MAKKTIRRRKPLTEEQKAERRERLAKARANRKPTEYKSVHEDVPRDDSHPLCIKNVRSWIKTNKDELSSLRKTLRVKYDRNLNDRANILETYVANLENYLRTGVYQDARYGEQREGKIRSVVRVMAYHWEGQYKGMVKRSVGCLYPDVGLWTQEMNDEYYGKPVIEPKPKKRTRKKAK